MPFGLVNKYSRDISMANVVCPIWPSKRQVSGVLSDVLAVGKTFKEHENLSRVLERI